MRTFTKPIAVFLLLAMALSAALTSLSAAVLGPNNRQMGDVDGDGNVNIGDILKIRDHIFGAELTGDAKIAADLDFDGKINIMDILYIRDIIFGVKEVPDWPGGPSSDPSKTPGPSGGPGGKTPRVPTDSPPPISHTPFPTGFFFPMAPGSGGCFTRPQVNPNNTKVLTIGADMGGSIVSSDQGKFFRQYNFYGSPWSFAFDPNDDKMIYACAPGGLYQSDDQGKSFRSLIPPEGKISYSYDIPAGGFRRWTDGGIDGNTADRPVATYAAAVDPASGNILYAMCGNSIYKSMDKGASFKRLKFDLPDAPVLADGTSNLQLGFILSYNMLAHSTMKIYINPGSDTDKREIYLISNFSVVRFVDDGKDVLDAERVISLTGSYSYDGNNFVTKGQHLLDLTWAYDPATKKTDFYRMVRDQAGRMTPNSWHTLEKSTDNMQTWVELSANLPREYLNPHPTTGAPGYHLFNFVAAANKDEIYLSISINRRQAGSSNTNTMGVMKSEDGGATWDWSLYIKDCRIFPENFHNLGWLEIPSWGAGWNEDTWGFGAGGDTCILTNMGSSYASFDKGKNWTQIASQLVADSFYDVKSTQKNKDGEEEEVITKINGPFNATTGMDILFNHFVEVDPNYPNNLLAGYADVGAFMSNDGGHTWRQQRGAPWPNTLYHADFDPANPGVVWGAWNDHHNIPDTTGSMSEWNATYRQGHTGGICVSYDSGLTWEPKINGIKDVYMMDAKGNYILDESTGKPLPKRFLATDVIIDLTSDPDNRTLYCCAMGGKEFASSYCVYRSTDNGETWKPFEDGIEFDNPKHNVSKGRAWRFHRSEKDGRIYLNFATNGWSHRDNNTTGQMYERGATYYIDPGDDHWTRCNWLVGNGSVRVLNEIAVDPTDPNTIYVTGRAGVINTQIRFGGCHKSTNGGKSWKEIFPDTNNCEGIRIDPRDTNILYLTNANGFVQVSYDAGETWIQSREFVNHVNPKVAIPDWRDPEPKNMWVCTGGGSLFYGPMPPKGGYKD